MKITRRKLRRLINEEYAKLVRESNSPAMQFESLTQALQKYPKIYDDLCEYGDYDADYGLDPENADEIFGGLEDFLDLENNGTDRVSDWEKWSNGMMYPAEKPLLALSILLRGEPEGLTSATYSNVNFEKAGQILMDVLRRYEMPISYAAGINIDSMQRNRDIDSDLGANWKDKMV